LINYDIGSSLINLCTLYSTAKKHKIALSYSLSSNTILESNFEAVKQNMKFQQEDVELLKRYVAVLCTSYLNTGIEYEHLGDMFNALQSYLNAYSCSISNLGTNDPITEQSHSYYMKAKKKRENDTEPETRLDLTKKRINDLMIQGRRNSKI